MVTPDRRFRARVDDAIREGEKASVELATSHYQIRLASTACERTAVLIARGYARPAGVDWRYKKSLRGVRTDKRLSGC